jgi:hypothetical protein
VAKTLKAVAVPGPLTRAFVLAGILCWWAPGALAQTPIPTLFSTGVDNMGMVLPDRSQDPHYQLIQSPDLIDSGPDAWVVFSNNFPIPPWLANGPDSNWIAPNWNQRAGDAVGDYVYRTTFDLTGFDPATAHIEGQWATDNLGVDILINGVSTGITLEGGSTFQIFHPIVLPDGMYVAGMNTLDFVVNNLPPGFNPTGFRVELTGTASP